MRVILHGAGAEAKAAARFFQDMTDTELLVVDDSGGSLPGAKTVDRDTATALLHGAVFLRSPGIKPDHPLVLSARTNAAIATTPTGYWLAKHAPAGTVTITGTKGKSTASSLAALLLSAAGLHSSVYGNIGQPPLRDPLPDEAHPVVEMSSYMLHDVPPAEHLHVITNLYKDHLDWHGDLEAYHEAKLRPFRLNDRLPGIAPRSVIERYRLSQSVRAAEDLVSESDSLLRVGGDTVRLHGGPLDFRSLPLKANLRTAMAIGLQFTDGSAVVKAARAVVAQYRGLPSRQEIVKSSDGRTWINDALATIPEAAIEASRPYTERGLVLLIGGADRGQDFAALEVFLKAHPSIKVITFGPAGERLEAENRTHTDDFASAITSAEKACDRGGVILFSPAAPSAPPHRNFEERAALFRARAAASQSPPR